MEEFNLADTKALGINGVPTSAHYWSYAPGTGSDDETGAQIDLVLSHDNSRDIDIIECKYYKSEFTISKKYKDELINKREVFNRRTNNKYNVQLIIITPYGIKSNSHYNELSPVDLTLEALFELGK